MPPPSYRSIMTYIIDLFSDDIIYATCLEISTHKVRRACASEGKVPLDRKGDDSEIALSLMVEPAYASSTALEISRAQG